MDKQEIELAVLGSMMYDGCAIATSQLRPEEFTGRNRMLVQFINHLYLRDNKAPTVDDLIDFLEQEKLLIPDDYKLLGEAVVLANTNDPESLIRALRISNKTGKTNVEPPPPRPALQENKNSIYKGNNNVQVIDYKRQRDDTQDFHAQNEENKEFSVTNVTPQEGSVTQRDKEGQSVTQQDYIASSVAERVKEWVETTRGWFNYAELDRECNIQPFERTARRKAVQRLEASGKLERDLSRQGCYRYKDLDASTMQPVPVSQRKEIPLEFPLSVQKYVRILPKSIIVIAGVSNAGKTAYLMNFAAMNMNKHKIHYYSSEMEEIGFNERWEDITALNNLGNIPWNFEAREMNRDNFEDYISIAPNDIHIVDYLELTENFYLVGARLQSFYRALDKGVVLVGLQKNSDKELGLGGNQGLFKTSLYMSLDVGSHSKPNRLTLVKPKIWRGSVNPKGMYAEFNLIKGAKFVEQRPLGHYTAHLTSQPQGNSPKTGQRKLF